MFIGNVQSLQMLFAAMTRLVEGLSLERLQTLKVGKVSDLPSGYTETNNIHNKTTVNFVLEKVNTN
jgi:hypothetical protein